MGSEIVTTSMLRAQSNSYVGDGETQTITLGYRPVSVKISTDNGEIEAKKFGSSPTLGHGQMAAAGAKAMRAFKVAVGGIEFTDTGFTVTGDIVNKVGVTYFYEVRGG